MAEFNWFSDAGTILVFARYGDRAPVQKTVRGGGVFFIGAHAEKGQQMTKVDLNGSGGTFAKAAKQAQLSTEVEGQAALNPESQDAISRQLRQVYGDLLNAPMPDKFKALLDSLSAQGDKE